MRYIITVNGKIRSTALAEDAKVRDGLYELIPAVTPGELPGDIDLRNARPGWRDLSRMEYCCVLSHARALEAVIARGEEAAMICEDDITIDEAAMARDEARLGAYMDGNTVTIIGCQQGMKFGGYFAMRSRLTAVRLLSPETRVIYRTCCYMLDAGAARKLLALYMAEPKCIADDWYHIVRQTGLALRFFDGASHPRDLGDSYLEATRHGKG